MLTPPISTHTHTETTSTPLPFLLFQTGIHPVRQRTLSFLHLSSSIYASHSLPSPFFPLHLSIQRFLSILPSTPTLTHTHTHLPPLPSVWTPLAPGNKQRSVCVRGGRDGVSLREGTMLLLVALNLSLLLLFRSLVLRPTVSVFTCEIVL